MAFHPEGVGRGKSAAQNRAEKECRVREGTAHAALVYDGGTCVGWCQFGSPDELPRIKHQRAYRDGLTRLPDWRITCFFVDKAYRGRESRLPRSRVHCRKSRAWVVARSRATPKTLPAASVSASFLHNGSISMFEKEGV